MQIINPELVAEARALAEESDGMISLEIIHSFIPKGEPLRDEVATGLANLLRDEGIRIVGHEELLGKDEVAEIEELWTAEKARQTLSDAPAHLRQLLSHPVLPWEEQRELIRRGQAGDKQARDRFLLSYARFVAGVAHSYRRKWGARHLGLEDLFMEGWIGLQKAFECFELERGWRFSSYAMYWIRQAISRSLRNLERGVRIPVHVHDARGRYIRAQKELRQRLDHEPTPDELREKLDVSERVFGNLEMVMRQHEVSLDAPVGPDDDRSFVEFLTATQISAPDESAIEPRLEANAELLWRMRTFEPLVRELMLLRLRGWTLEEVGERFGYARERVRQIQVRALIHMRLPMGKMGFAPGEPEYLQNAVRVSYGAEKGQRLFCWERFRPWIEQLEGVSAPRELLELKNARMLTQRAWLLAQSYWLDAVDEQEFSRRVLVALTPSYTRGFVKPTVRMLKGAYRCLANVAWLCRRLRRGLPDLPETVELDLRPVEESRSVESAARAIVSVAPKGDGVAPERRAAKPTPRGRRKPAQKSCFCARLKQDAEAATRHMLHRLRTEPRRAPAVERRLLERARRISTLLVEVRIALADHRVCLSLRQSNKRRLLARHKARRTGS